MENETINEKLDKILSAKNAVKAAFTAAGYDMSGGFATYGAAASSLTSVVDGDISEIREDVGAVSARVSSYSEAWKEGVDAETARTADELSSLSRRADSAAGQIDVMKGMLVAPKKLVPDLVQLSSWLVVDPNTMKVRQQFSTGGYGNYTAYKYVVEGGRTYQVRTGFGGQNTGLGLFLYNEDLSVGYDNSVSCLAYNPSGAGIFNIEFKVPASERRYVLGTFNSSTSLPSSNMFVQDKYPDECRYNLTRIGKDIYAPSRVDAAEIVAGSWYTASNDYSVNQSYASDPSTSLYSVLKYAVEGGKTYSIHTNMKAALAIGLFTLADQLSTGNKNTLSVIVRRPSSGEPELIYDLSVQIPDYFGDCVLGVSHAEKAACRLSDVQVVDIYHAASTPAEVFARLSALELEVAELSANAAADEAIHVYGDKCRFDELCASTTSAWTNGTFDKGKFAFMLDDARTDVGYIASFLSSQYGYPMGFAVGYSRIGGNLIQSYTEDNGDGTSSTYECPFATVSDLLIAEEAFGGETWAHDCSKGRWMLSVDGEGLVPKFSQKMAEYHFVEIRSALQALGLKVDGFVSPWHDPLDWCAPQMAKYFKYARWSTRNYPNLPYQIPLHSISLESSTMEQKKQWIDEAVAGRKLVLFYGHGVGSGSGISMKGLKELLDYVKEKVDAGVLDVTTLKALYAARQQ